MPISSLLRRYKQMKGTKDMLPLQKLFYRQIMKKFHWNLLNFTVKWHGNPVNDANDSKEKALNKGEGK